MLAEWHGLPKRFANVQIDAFVIIPNHIHGILWILPTNTQSPTKPDAMNRIPTLGDILRAFKSAATRRIRQQGFSDFAWQSNYYEHIIRNETSLANIRNYIINNPLQWSLDNENPAHL